MAKDPAFLFYPNDFIGGTMGMTFEEKGAYIELLMMQFNRGHMTNHMIGQTVGQLWLKCQDKFIQDEQGLWYNKRLDEEKNKRQNYTKSRNNNRSGVNQYTKNQENSGGHMTNHMTGHTTGHMENENVNSIIINSCIKNNTVKEYKDSNGTWEDEKRLFENSEQYFYKLCTKFSVEKTKMDEFAREFISQIELKEDFKSEKELKKHFANWMNKKNLKKEEPKLKNNYIVQTPKHLW